ncbi:MAG: PqqD family peptide modification chaperone [Burkholderiaceae bacterium]
MSRPRIFVHIPSYRDRECQWTLRDLFERARHPERVFAGVCWQTDPDEDRDCFLIRPRPAQVRSVHFHYREAHGLGWARAQAQALWDGEEYCLQLDSHMRFVDGWDELLLEMLAACAESDAVLTHYPAGYQPPDRREYLDRPHVQTIKGFMQSGLLEFTVSLVPEGIVVDRPMPTAALAGAFVFGSSRILRDVPSDPEIYFNGEEPNLAVRLWTSGFDLFSPHRPVMFHYYLRKDGARHWNDAQPRGTQLRQGHTLHRLRLLCEPEAFDPEQVAVLGRYGLGKARSLAEYEAFAGVDFGARSLAVEARRYPFVRPIEVQRFALVDALRPANGTQLFVLGDEGVLFSEARGTLHRFNEAATSIWCALEAGHDWERIVNELAASRGIAVDTMRAELRELASHWNAEGLLVDSTALSANGPRLDAIDANATTRCYRLLDTFVCIRYGDAAIEAWIHPAFEHLQVEGDDVTPSLVLTVVGILDWRYVFAGTRLLHLGDSSSGLVPRLKAEFMSHAIARHDHMIHLHAAAVMKHGRLMLLPGKSGSGKTLLTAKLIARGVEYFSDEAVLLSLPDAGVRPIPTGLCIKAEGLPHLAADFPMLAEQPEHDREDGLTVRYLRPPASSIAPLGRRSRADFIVFPRYEAHAKTQSRRIASADALGRLSAECLAIPRALTAQAVAALVESVERASCWSLTIGDDDDGVQRVIDLLDEYDGAAETHPSLQCGSARQG